MSYHNLKILGAFRRSLCFWYFRFFLFFNVFAFLVILVGQQSGPSSVASRVIRRVGLKRIYLSMVAAVVSAVWSTDIDLGLFDVILALIFLIIDITVNRHNVILFDQRE